MDICVAVCCSVLQCVAVWCSVSICVLSVDGDGFLYCSVLQRVAVCCSVLQCVAVCCCVLQCIAVCCSVLQCESGLARLNTKMNKWEVRCWCKRKSMDGWIGICKSVTVDEDGYGVATISRLFKNIGLFCKRALQKR